MSDSDPIGLFQTVAKELNKKKIAYLCLSEAFSFDASNAQLKERFYADKEHKNIKPYVKPLLTSVLYMANAGYDFDSGNAALQNKEADLVAYGTNFICNSDLVELLKENKPIRHLGNVKDMSKLFTEYFYMGGASGYTDLTPYEA